MPLPPTLVIEQHEWNEQIAQEYGPHAFLTMMLNFSFSSSPWHVTVYQVISQIQAKALKFTVLTTIVDTISILVMVCCENIWVGIDRYASLINWQA